MVKKIIGWLLNLAAKHGYKLVTYDDTVHMINSCDAGTINRIAKLEERIVLLQSRVENLEQWQQQAEPKINERNEISIMVDEWINGEAASGDRS